MKTLKAILFTPCTPLQIVCCLWLGGRFRHSKASNCTVFGSWKNAYNETALYEVRKTSKICKISLMYLKKEAIWISPFGACRKFFVYFFFHFFSLFIDTKTFLLKNICFYDRKKFLGIHSQNNFKQKLNFFCGNYSRDETIQGWKLYKENRYLDPLR